MDRGTRYLLVLVAAIVVDGLVQIAIGEGLAMGGPITAIAAGVMLGRLTRQLDRAELAAATPPLSWAS